MRKFLSLKSKRQVALEEAKLKLEQDKLEHEKKKLSYQNNALAMLAEEASRSKEARRYTPPVLPKGVIPKGKSSIIGMDSCSSIYDYAGQQDASFFPAFIGYPALASLTQSSDYRSVPETTAGEMVREWGRFKIVDNSTIDDTLTDVEQEALILQRNQEQAARQHKINALHDCFKKHDIRKLVQRMIEVDGQFGRAQLFIKLKGHDQSLPLVDSKAGISKGSLEGFSLIEPMWSTPSMYNADDPTSSDFYVPQSWWVLGRDTHADRLITLIMRPVPDILKPAYNFGGISMVQLMQPYVERYQRTADSISQIIHAFSLTMLSTDLSTILSGQNDPNPLMRMRLFNQHRDNSGIMLIDKENEEISQINTPLSGLPELFRQSQEQMSAPSHTPLVKLLGITPSGLNANSEGELEVYRDYIMALNESYIRPVVERLSRIMQLSLFGEIDEAIQWVFHPLKQMTSTELAQEQKTKAETSQILIDANVISNQEAREALSSDEESPYSGIDANDVPEVEVYDYEKFDET